jgi:hypothetical protein
MIQGLPSRKTYASRRFGVNFRLRWPLVRPQGTRGGTFALRYHFTSIRHLQAIKHARHT